jgi:hypothetical protein
MKEIVLEYLKLKSDISTLLKMSGYKTNFVAGELGIQPTTFSVKRQRANWSESEVLKILDVIETEKLEDYYLGKMMSEMNETEFISLSDFKKAHNR